MFKNTLLLLSLILLASPAWAASPSLKSEKSRVSYILGMQMGTNLKRQNVELDLAAINAGLSDGMKGKKSKISEDEMRKVMDAFRQKMMAKQKDQKATQGKANIAAGNKWLAKNGKKKGVKTTKSGLQYKVVKTGKGPKPTADAKVEVHYEGKLISGKVFDSSYKRGTPASFPVGGVIAGWTEALMMMPAGSHWELYIPAKLAYGERGMGPIEPNSVLIFKVELLKVL